MMWDSPPSVTATISFYISYCIIFDMIIRVVTLISVFFSPRLISGTYYYYVNI